MTAETPARPARRSWFWLQGAVAGGIAVAFPGTALLTAALLCPALAFYVAEQAKGRPVGRIMLLTGSAAAFMPLRALWEHGASLATALDILADPSCALIAWVACGAGWLLCEAAQVCAKFALAAQARRKMAGLRRELDTLVEEWTFNENGPRT